MPAQSTLIRSKSDAFERLGLAFQNRSAERACAPYIVPKAGPQGFRFTVDMRRVTYQTKLHVWPMHNAHIKLPRLSGSTLFARFDIISAYWLMPLVEGASLEYQSFHALNKSVASVIARRRLSHVSVYSALFMHLFNVPMYRCGMCGRHRLVWAVVVKFWYFAPSDLLQR